MTEYTPDEMTVRSSYFDAASSLHGMDGEETHAEFDRFLARARRDAAREALNGLADGYASEPDIGEPEFECEAFVIQAARHYPETED